MSAAPTGEVNARERAALLWDLPSLAAEAHQDGGADQLRAALRLDVDLVGEVIADDPLSLAAHLVVASLLDQDPGPELATQLAATGAAGRVLATTIEIVFALDEGASPRLGEALREHQQLAEGLFDQELQARLLVRTVAWARLTGDLALARTAIARVLELTSVETRLGETARRTAVLLGLEVPGVRPYEPLRTPHDVLLSLPWVLELTTTAATSMSTAQLNRQLAGIRDSSFSWGRTVLDDLQAANLQAEWCGNLAVRADLQKLLAAAALQQPNVSDEFRRWGLRAWALQAAPRIPAAAGLVEDAFDHQSAQALLSSIERAPNLPWQTYVEIALGIWDLLDDAAVGEMLQVAVELLPADDEPRLSTLLGNLL